MRWLWGPVHPPPLPVKAAAVAPPVYDWSGFYFGGLVGYGFGNQNLNNASGPAGFANFTTNWGKRMARWPAARPATTG